jgi:Uma2 family endonuclease
MTTSRQYSRPSFDADTSPSTNGIDGIEQPLSVDKYHELIRAGILTENNSVELLEGRLVQKMTKKPPHCLATLLLRETLRKVVPEGWYVDSQEPVTLSDGEPEPDGTVVRGEPRQYKDRHPNPTDLALVVEVADTNLEWDRTEKLRSYARAGISVYWIVNLCDGQLEVYTEPSGPTAPPDQPSYACHITYGPEQMAPVVIEGKEVAQLAVRDFLP